MSEHDTSTTIALDASSGSPLLVRHMLATDSPAVHAIQCCSYPEYLHETAECMNDRRAIWPAGSFVLERAGIVEAYIQSHPWHADTVPPSLHDADLEARIASAADAKHTFYLHDVASTSSVRGAGTALLLHALMSAYDAGYRSFVLVAVLGQDTRWAKLGFKPLRKLDGYGPGGGVFMRFDADTAASTDGSLSASALSGGRSLPLLRSTA